MAANRDTDPCWEIDYVLEWPTSAASHLCASLELVGDATGESRFGLDSTWSRVPPDSVWIRSVHARGSDGRELQCRALGDSRFELRHRPSERVHLTWEIAPIIPPDGDPLGGRRPVVRAEFTHLVGKGALLAPLWLVDGSEPREIRVRWRGVERAGWSVTSSRGSASEVRATDTLRSFSDTVLLAGALELERREVLGGHLLVAAPRAPRTPSLAGLADAAARIVDVARAFFRDESSSFLLVSVVPLAAQGARVDALHATDAFTLFQRADTEPAALLTVLARELFRTWCGETIHLNVVAGQDLWFSEGFARFYAGRLLRAAGLTTRAQRYAEVERVLADDHVSPLRALDVEALAERSFSDDEAFEQAWRRGFLVALVLDAEMRRTSHGRRSLDDLLRELLVEARARDGAFTPAELHARFALSTAPDFARRLGAWIERGLQPEFDPTSLSVFGTYRAPGSGLGPPTLSPGSSLEP